MHGHIERGADRRPPEPHNIEVEQALLGAIMVNNEAHYFVSSFLKADHFYEPLHAAIYGVIDVMVQARKPANPITIKDFLPSIQVQGLTVSQYLARLCAEATTVINAADYAKIIVDFSVRRRAILVASEAIERFCSSDPGVTAAACLEALETDLLTVDEESRGGGGRDGGELVTLEAAFTRTIDSAANAFRHEGRTIGVTWGVRSLDEKTGGLYPEEMVVLAGRPGMGKSAVAIEVALAAARQVPEEGQPRPGVLIISPEMSADATGGRALTAIMARRQHDSHERIIPYTALRSGRFEASDFDRMIDAVQRNTDIPVILDESATITMGGISSAVRRAKIKLRKRGCKLVLVVVDYMQMVMSGDRYRGKRVDEVSEISAGLKRLAKSEKLAVLALSQLSREVERREDKRPILADLRESGSIEQDADAVIFVFREQYYLERSEPADATSQEYFEWQAKYDASRGRLEFIIAKQRHGPVGHASAFFDPATNMLCDIGDPFAIYSADHNREIGRLGL